MNQLTDARFELLRRRRRGVAPAGSVAVATPSDSLGIAERRMWKIYQLDPESITHNIGLVLTFGPSYSADDVVASLRLMVRNASVLGSTIVVDDDGVPRRSPDRRDGRWVEPGAVWEWGVLPAYDSSAPVSDIAAALGKSPFDLRNEPPMRARVQATDGGVTVVLVVHHLAVDDTSWPLLLGTLVSGSWAGDSIRTAGADSAIAPATVERAVARAQSTWAADDVRYPLSGALPDIDAAQSWLSPLDDGPVERLTETVDAEAIAALGEVARSIGATSSAVLIGVCALSVYALTGAADHVLLVPSDNRSPGANPSEVGYSGNIVPMRFTFDPEAGVADSLRSAAASVYESFEFATIDYGTILTALRGAGGRFPVAEIMASVRNAPLRGIPTAGQVTCSSVFTSVGNYPLTMAFEIANDESVHLEIDYRPDIVEASLAQRAAQVTTDLVAHIPQLLDAPVQQLLSTVDSTDPLSAHRRTGANRVS